MDTFAEVLTGLKPDTDSQVVTEVREISAGYAAGELDLETYTQMVSTLYEADCVACGKRWQYEVPTADGAGARNLCHDCFWGLPDDYKVLVQRLQSGEVIEFGYGVLVRELAAAFSGEWDSVAYAEAGQALAVMCAPISQTCEAIVSDGLGGHELCHETTSARMCPACRSAMPEIGAVWRGMIAKAQERLDAANTDDVK